MHASNMLVQKGARSLLKMGAGRRVPEFPVEIQQDVEYIKPEKLCGFHIISDK